MKKLSIRATALILAFLLAVAPAASASQALGTEIHHGTVQLAQGVDLTRQYLWSATYSDLRTERYIEYTPNTLVQPAVAYGSSILSKSTLAALAQGLESQGKRVVGGINGDYFVMATGSPLGIVITDGVLRSASSSHYALGFDLDGNAMVGKPELSITATFGDQSYSVSGGLNKTRSANGGLVLYTDDFGATTRHTAPGIDVILTPLTNQLGELIEITLDVETLPDLSAQDTPDRSQTSGADDADTPATDSSTLDTDDFPADNDRDDSPRQIRDTLIYSDVPIVGGRISCKVEQVLYSDTAIDIPEGKMVLSIHADGSDTLYDSLSALQAGDLLHVDITSPDARWERVVTAVGGLYKMVTDGQVESGLETAQAPRTAVGIRPDGTTVFYTVDGRQSGYSVGASMSQVARRLVELGCTEAICMDGGGSTTLGATLPGDDTFGILNKPSEGKARAVSNALFLVADQFDPGPVASLAIAPGDAILLSGESINLSAVGVDAIGQHVKEYKPTAVTFTASSDAGKMNGSTFTAGDTPGTYSIKARVGSKTAEVYVTVVTTPDQIALTKTGSDTALTSLTLNPGASIQLDASASYRNLDLLCHDELFTWSVTEGLGTIDQSGTFIAGTDTGSGFISVTAGENTLTVPVSLSAHVATVETFEGDFSAMADSLTAQIRPETQAAYVRFGKQSARITYNTAEAEYAAVSAPLEFQSGETYLSLWVYGDGSGNTLTAPIRTADNTVSEQILAVLNFTGWQQIITPLPTNAASMSIFKIKPTGTVSSGTIRLDQITTSNQYEPDHTAPTISLHLDELGLTAVLSDNIDQTFSAEQVSVSYDGQVLKSALNGLTVTAPLPELDGKAHRVTVTVTDASGNIGRSSYDIKADYGSVSPFADVSGHWAGSYVNYLYEQGIVNGVSSNGQFLFLPNKAITRGEFAVITARWLRLDLAQYSSIELPFVDADSIPSWALDGVKAMYALGLMQGSTGSGGTYINAGKTITRAEALTLLGRIQEKGYPTTELTFSDAEKIPSWAADYVATLVAQGLVNGYSNNNFGPGDSINRGQVAKILYSMR